MGRKERAKEFRVAGVLAAQSASDSVAATMPTMYEEWKAGVHYGDSGFPQIVNRKGNLYRCQQAHVSQIGWEPENAPALWVAINKTNAGTAEDPIPATRGMEYTYGLYYADPEDGLIYLCERSGEPDGGTIVLQFLPHELEGIYFSLVSGSDEM